MSRHTQPIAEAPGDELFGNAAQWEIHVGTGELKYVSDIWLQVRYVGDVARLYSGPELLDENLYDGLPWNIGLKRLWGQPTSGWLTLEILPLRSDAPIYIPARFRPNPASDEQIAKAESITAIPECELVVEWPEP